MLLLLQRILGILQLNTTVDHFLIRQSQVRGSLPLCTSYAKFDRVTRGHFLDTINFLFSHSPACIMQKSHRRDLTKADE